MRRSSEFHDYVMHDLLGNIPGITSRAMFGGHGIYKGGLFFACIMDSVLYFKVDDTNRAQYEKYGSKPFVYDMKGKKMTMSYYEVPEKVMEDAEQLREWVAQSVAVAKKAKKKHPR
jgi:DNA transformation protein and related proteins